VEAATGASTTIQYIPIKATAVKIVYDGSTKSRGVNWRGWTRM